MHEFALSLAAARSTAWNPWLAVQCARARLRGIRVHLGAAAATAAADASEPHPTPSCRRQRRATLPMRACAHLCVTTELLAAGSAVDRGSSAAAGRKVLRHCTQPGHCRALHRRAPVARARCTLRNLFWLIAYACTPQIVEPRCTCGISRAACGWAPRYRRCACLVRHLDSSAIRGRGATATSVRPRRGIFLPYLSAQAPCPPSADLCLPLLSRRAREFCLEYACLRGCVRPSGARSPPHR
jgi:hypothetical protein